MNKTPTPLTATDRDELARLLAQPIAFIDHPSFHEADAERHIITDAAPLPEPATAWLTPTLYKSSVGEHAPRGKRLRFMTAEQEQSAFIQFNFARMNAARCSAAISAGDDSDAMAHDLLRWHRLAVRVRNVIVGHHLAAVIQISRGWQVAGYEKDDILSEGFRMLIELVGRFDCTGNGRFMAAVMASVRGCFHHLHDRSKKYCKSFGEFDPKLMACNDHIGQRREEDRLHLVDELRTILAQNRALLTPNELKILKARFWCSAKPSSRNTMGLMPVMHIESTFRMHHRRVIRLLASAMQKLRAAVQWAMERRAIATIVAERFKNRIIHRAIA